MSENKISQIRDGLAVAIEGGAYMPLEKAAIEARNLLSDLELKFDNSSPVPLNALFDSTTVFHPNEYLGQVVRQLLAYRVFEQGGVPTISGDPRFASLHPNTAALVDRFAFALAEKLLITQGKRGQGHAQDWEDPRCLAGLNAALLEAVEKGDPVDVAAFAAFIWHHGGASSLLLPIGTLLSKLKGQTGEDYFTHSDARLHTPPVRWRCVADHEFPIDTPDGYRKLCVVRIENRDPDRDWDEAIVYDWWSYRSAPLPGDRVGFWESHDGCVTHWIYAEELLESGPWKKQENS